MPKVAICSPDISNKIQVTFSRLDITVLKIPHCPDVAEPVSGHPDIQVFNAGEYLFCHNSISADFIEKASEFFKIIICSKKLMSEYPKDIAFNAKLAYGHMFHRLSHTAVEITGYLMKMNIKMIDVRQGYSGCSVLTTGENSIITADSGIHAAANKAGLTSLLISPGFISLPGYSYGFIGGCGGFSQNKLYLSGLFDHHPDADAIKDLLYKNCVDLIYLSDDMIRDYGSFIIREF